MEKLFKAKSSYKRTNYLEWQEYFMAIAFLSAQRSKDPRTQVGACIVNDENKVVGIGYNGMPIGCNDDIMPWSRAHGESKEKWLESKSPYVCHAELNAVLNKNLADIKGCVIYVALFPCNMCAQIIIQSGIRQVIYYSDKYHHRSEFRASRFLLDTAGVKYRQYRPRQKQIVIDFNFIEGTPEDQAFLHSSDNSHPTSTNNNNSGLLKVPHLENHAEQQELQHIQQIQALTPSLSASFYLQEASLSPLQRSDTLEISFAAVSILFFSFVAFVSWYLASSNIIVITP